MIKDDGRNVGANLTEETPLRLEWRRTRNVVEKDFTCFSPEADMTGQVGRIHLTLGPRGAEHWFWTCYGTIGGSRLLHTSGHAETKMEAARLVERAWFAWVAQAAIEGRVRLHEGNRAEWGELSKGRST